MTNRFQSSLIVLILFLIFIPAGLFAQERKSSPQTSRLPNGIRVVVEEDHSAPIIAIQAWIRAGSADESEEQAGLAHLLEHMLFRRVMPPGSELERLAEQVETSGGDINAYTSPDCTVVHLVLPAEAFETGLQAVTSVFSRPEFDPSDLEEEKKVVIEEINRSEDLPAGFLMRRLFSESFWVHPYGRPVIGNRESVERLTVQDLESFFLQHYQPERIVFSVAGDVSMEKVIKGLEEKFKIISSKLKTPTSNNPRPTPKYQPPAAFSHSPEPPQKGFRREVSRGRWNQAYLNLAFHTAGVNDDRVAEADILASLLGEGSDSRLSRELEGRRRLVFSISASSYTPADSGLLIIRAELDPNNVPQAFQAILEELDSLHRGGIRPEELKRAQAQMVSEYFRDGESREGRAGQLGFLYTLTPGISYETGYLKKVNQATAEGIRQAAEKYLRIDNLTAVVLLPENSLPDFSEADFDAGLVDYFRAGEGRTGKPESAFSGKAVERNESGMKIQFPNGLRLIIRKRPGSGTVAVVTAFRGGLLSEKPGKEGISNLLAELLTRGNERLGPLGIAEKTKLLGGTVEAFSGLQSLGLKSDFLASQWLEGLELAAEMIQTPTFLDNEMDKLKEKMVAGIKSRDENLLQLAFLRLREVLYGHKPYGHDVLGSLASIPRITRDDLRDFYREVIRPDNLVLAVIGDIKEEDVISQAARLWSGWITPENQNPKFQTQNGEKTGGESQEASDAVRVIIEEEESGPPDKSTPANEPREFWFPFPGSKQVNLVWGFPGTTFLSPERYPLELVNAILSGMSGRLFRNIRDREGLAYAIGSSNVTGVERGFLALYLATSPERMKNAIEAMERELADLRQGAISEEELGRAKAYIVGNFEASRQTNLEMALGMALDETYGLGFGFAPAYINKVKEVDIRALNQAIGIYLDKNLEFMIGIGAIKQ